MQLFVWMIIDNKKTWEESNVDRPFWVVKSQDICVLYV